VNEPLRVEDDSPILPDELSMAEFMLSKPSPPGSMLILLNAFDPISWAAGFVLTNAAKKGLDLVFTADLRSTLEKEIEEWSETLPAYAHPATLFSVVDSAPHDEHRPALVRVRDQILDLEIPSREEWAGAFIEQWRSIGERLGTQAQPFFHLDEAQARPYLIDLAAPKTMALWIP
jgi:hypothetical protein